MTGVVLVVGDVQGGPGERERDNNDTAVDRIQRMIQFNTIN